MLPISQNYTEYTKKLVQQLSDAGFRVEHDDRNEKIGYKIREAQMEKVPYMLIAGEKEETDGTVSVRSHKEGDLGSMSLQDFIQKIAVEVQTKAR